MLNSTSLLSNFDQKRVTPETTDDQLYGELLTNAKLLSGEIIIAAMDKHLKSVLAHEVGHSDQAINNPAKYFMDVKKGEKIKKHDDRPAEKYANEYQKKVERELQ